MKKITAMVAGISLAFTLSAAPANAGFFDSVKGAFSGGSKTISSMLSKGKDLIKTHGPTLLSAGASLAGSGALAGFLGGGSSSETTGKHKKKH